ncbi:hypothetical protein E2C01_002491 [Portunus trituberculatus]|uniref:Uncharacterized protein n=1 Tax=Portunus trituberculatus TaxID=210409 RepID=A0A5B7CJH9_PORTR|nr:hypothetical protein [Portunus trituberculatus]
MQKHQPPGRSAPVGTCELNGRRLEFCPKPPTQPNPRTTTTTTTTITATISTTKCGVSQGRVLVRAASHRTSQPRLTWRTRVLQRRFCYDDRRKETVGVVKLKRRVILDAGAIPRGKKQTRNVFLAPGYQGTTGKPGVNLAFGMQKISKTSENL